LGIWIEFLLVVAVNFVVNLLHSTDLVLIVLVIDLLCQSLVLFFDNEVSLLWNFFAVEVIIKTLENKWVSWNIVLVDIIGFQNLGDALLNIGNPVGSLP